MQPLLSGVLSLCIRGNGSGCRCRSDDGDPDHEVMGSSLPARRLQGHKMGAASERYRSADHSEPTAPPPVGIEILCPPEHVSWWDVMFMEPYPRKCSLS